MFSVLFGILSAVCLVYFGIIVLYSGIKTSAVWIWLVLAVLFFLLSRGIVYYHQHKKQIPLWIPVSVVTLCTTGAVVFVILQILIFGGMIRTAPEHLDYLIILGARVREDDISTSLKHRLDKAIRFAQEHPETKLILSGGQGEGEPTTEAQAMAEYLAYNGIAPEQMLLEMYSTNTTENMICSKTVIEVWRQREKENFQKALVEESRRRLELSGFLLKLEQRAQKQEGRLSQDEGGEWEIRTDTDAQEEGQPKRKRTLLERTYDPKLAARQEKVNRCREILAKGAQNQQKDYGPGQGVYWGTYGESAQGYSGSGQSFQALMRVYPGAAELLPDKPLQIGVLTSNFHLYRAMKIGKKCGFDQLYGVASRADPVLFVHLCVRESIAILKDKFMGNM